MELPPKTIDYMVKQLTKFLSDDPAVSDQLKTILGDVMGSKKDTLRHFDVLAGEIGAAITTTGIPPGVDGHLLTVTDRNGRTRYLFFI